MNEVKHILLLRRQNFPIKQIARQLGLSKNTVKAYIKRAESIEFTDAELQAIANPELESKLKTVGLSDQQRYQEFLEHAPRYLQELKSHRHLTKILLWEEEFNAGRTAYRYSQFCHHLLTFEKRKEGSMVIDHTPGEKMFIDFAGDKLAYTDPHSGKLTPCHILLLTLGYSNYTKVVAIPSQSTEHTIQGLVQCIEELGGVCKALIPDNFKGAVIKADRYEPRINDRFLDMSNYYGFAVLPTRIAKPTDKPKVETAVRNVYQRIYAGLRHQSFGSLKALNDALKERCIGFNARKMKEYGASRQELFDRDEKHLLKELPSNRYELVSQHSLKVQSNNYVQLSKLNKYFSVPHSLIGQQVSVLCSTNLIRIYHKGECVATHVGPFARYTSNPNHMGSTHHEYLKSINPEVLKQRGYAIDTTIGQVIDHLLNRPMHPEQNYKSCQGVLSLVKKHDVSKLIEACTIALHANIVGYGYIQRICSTPYSTAKDQVTTTGPLPDHENTRGNYF